MKRFCIVCGQLLKKDRVGNLCPKCAIKRYNEIMKQRSEKPKPNSKMLIKNQIQTEEAPEETPIEPEEEMPEETSEEETSEE